MALGAKLGAIDFVNDATWRLLSTGGNSYAGAPQPRVTTLDSSVLDGSIVVHDSDDNRTLTFRVAWGTKVLSSETRSAAAKRVEYELGKRNTFLYSPMNGEPSGVYQVQDSKWDYISSDTDEKAGVGIWEVELTCHPYVFSQTAVTETALFGTGTGDTVMDNGTSATGWSSPFGSVTASGGVLRIPVNAATNPVTGRITTSIQATKTFSSTNFSTTPFVRQEVQLPPDVDLNSINVTLFSMGNAVGAGASAKYVGATPSSTTGYTTLWFYFAAPLTNATSYTFYLTWDANSGGGTLGLDNVTRSGSAPYLPGASTVTSLRHINVAGSRRTPGSLALDVTAGSVPWMVYTGPNLGVGGAYNPQILTTQVTITAGGGTSSTSVTVPVAGLPRGGYIVVADVAGARNGSVSAAAPVSLGWTATQTGGPSQSGTQVFDTVFSSPVATYSRRMATLGPVVLPLADVSATSTATMTFTFTPGSSSNHTIYAVFLLYMGPGAAVTMQDVSTARYVFLNSATIDRPWPQVLSGSLADGSNAISQLGAMRSVMRHIFRPPVQMLLVYAGGVAAPTGALTHTPCFGDFPDQ